jgi:hypothetical protein
MSRPPQTKQERSSRCLTDAGKATTSLAQDMTCTNSFIATNYRYRISGVSPRVWGTFVPTGATLVVLYFMFMNLAQLALLSEELLAIVCTPHWAGITKDFSSACDTDDKGALEGSFA